jgi:hypothetical protein
MPAAYGMVLIGSLAAGSADALSDVDLFVVARPGAFQAMWAKRRELSGSSVLASWESHSTDRPDVGFYVWLSEELVMVEALFCVPGSARLADGAPAAILVGPPSLLDTFPRRPPVRRSEMRFTHPVEKAYKALQDVIRQNREVGRADGAAD